MIATTKLHHLGQSLWIDDINRELLNSGLLEKYIREFSVTGLTSNPSIFAKAIKESTDYDQSIVQLAKLGKSGEGLFFELAFEDLRRAADLFRPVFERTRGQDGWVSLEVSPLLAYDTAGSIAAARDLHARANRQNLFIKIPGTKEGLPAIEECIFAGIPVNVTLLFSREHYLAAAEAYLRGIERRIAAGLPADVRSVASLFISRWDAAVAGKTPEALHNQLGVAVAKSAYKAYLELLDSPRMALIRQAGGQHQRLLWASTGTKDPKASDIFYITSLAAPNTINTMPQSTLMAYADHGDVGPLVALDVRDTGETLGRFSRTDIDVEALAARLQVEGAKSFSKSWNELMEAIEAKSSATIGIA